jgi:hypothetical protein
MEKIKLAVFAIAIALSGIVFGTVLQEIISPAATYAYSVTNDDCDDEECEFGFLCVDNPGGNTNCEDRDDGDCQTVGCCTGCDVED